MYNGWARRIAERVQRRFEEIDAHYNFDFGDEFEIAVAEILRYLLPARAGVCRGFIVAGNDAIAGDDIIIFDRVHFPTLRVLGDSLALKEYVPLEAVLAYIEAKHTLYLEEGEEKGASLAKACKQIRAVHALPERDRVSPQQIAPRLSLRPDQFAAVPRAGYFDHRNPLYCAIFARHVVFSAGEKRAPLVPDIDRVGLAVTAEQAKGPFPSTIAAGELLLVPVLHGSNEVRPVVGPLGVLSHASLIEGGSLGLGVLHLLSAMQQFTLGTLPWEDMLAEAERTMKRRP